MSSLVPLDYVQSLYTLEYFQRRTAYSCLKTMQESFFPIDTAGDDGWRDLGDQLQRVWALGILRRSGTQVVVDGGDNIDPQRRYIVVCNHQSFFDIPCLIAGLPLSLRFVAKSELRNVPAFGLAIHNLGHVLIDRSQGREAFSKMCQDADRSGTSVVIFPEGTRTPDGQLCPFKGGAFYMAKETGWPILPVAVDGTFGVVPSSRVWLKCGQKVNIRVGQPVEVTERTPDELRMECRDRVQDLLDGRESG